eukprot:GFUD01025636.1.p1 GENE.GFUD01025636.1~~GFUD01025636.1.p1  ORF type:complete len:276 (-),score=89.38 GFUD01025636.1:112-939(-)
MDNLQFSVDNEGVAILGSEYCSGYIDILGTWNTGFYCPSSDETVNVFCCGSDTYKYCCTKKDQVLQEEMEGLTVVIGVLVGASTALLLLTIVLCVCCPWCPNYNKKYYEKQRGPVYHLPHPGSSASQGTTTYSVSNGASDSTSPLAPSLTGQDTARPSQQAVQLYRQGMSHSHTLPHSLSHHHSFRVREEGVRTTNTDRKYGTLGRQPREQPPAYHILPRASYLLIPQDTPDLLSETKIQADTALHSLSQSMAKVNMMEINKEEEEEEIYQSTKF